jgi:Na+-driven multidrug efflux pump
MYASAFSFWVIGISFAYCLGFMTRLEGRGVWIGLTIGVFTGALILYLRLRNRLKKIDLAEIMTTVASSS